MSDIRASQSPSRALVFPAPAIACVPIVNDREFFPVRRIYCVGRNYAAHVREMGGNEREPPFFFQKPADAIVPSGSVIEYPLATKSFQHEVELVIAIGAAGACIRTGQAQSHVFGFAVGVDLTRRDLQREARDAGRPWECGKSFDQSAPLGAIVRAGPAPLPSQAGISLRVNGGVRQQAVLGDMIWNCDEIVARLSLLYALEPGDLIFTGTPAGVADLNPGDRVEGSIEGVGELTFRVAPHKRPSTHP
jgi:fumarylpyruvate hydrolase